jgi:hypothetical protein
MEKPLIGPVHLLPGLVFTHASPPAALVNPRKFAVTDLKEPCVPRAQARLEGVEDIFFV